MPPELSYEATYRMRDSPQDIRNVPIHVTPSSADQHEHDAEALRQAHALEFSAPERELVRLARLAPAPGDPHGDVLLDRGAGST